MAVDSFADIQENSQRGKYKSFGKHQRRFLCYLPNVTEHNRASVAPKTLSLFTVTFLLFTSVDRVFEWNFLCVALSLSFQVLT